WYFKRRSAPTPRSRPRRRRSVHSNQDCGAHGRRRKESRTHRRIRTFASARSASGTLVGWTRGVAGVATDSAQFRALPCSAVNAIVQQRRLYLGWLKPRHVASVSRLGVGTTLKDNRPSASASLI